MSNTPPNVLQLARQGNPDAIASLMNRHLEAQGITAHVVQQESTLQVNLEGAQIHNQADLVAYVKKGITGLELAEVNHLTVSGKQAGASTSAWSENLTLREETSDFMLDFDAAPNNVSASDDSDLGLDLDFDLDSAALEINELSDLDAALGDQTSGADFDLDDLGLTDSGSAPSSDASGSDAPADFDLNFDDSDFGLDLTDTSPGSETTDSADLDLNFDDSDFGLDLTDTSAETTDSADLDLNFDDSDFGLDLADTSAETTDSADLDLNFDDSDFGLDLTDTSAGSEAADRASLDLDGSVDNAFESKELDLDLALAGEPPANTTDTDLDFDLDLPEATDFTDLDFDLDLADGPAELNTTPADSGFDLGFTDEPGETTTTSDLDFDLDLDSDSGEEAAANDLDFDLDLDSDSGETTTTDLDFDDLGLGDDGAASAADLDLGWVEEPAADSSAEELDLGLTEAPATDLSTTDFDLDLGMAETPTETSATDDLDLDTADFDLAFDALEDEAASESAEDLDLGFGAEFDPEAGLELPDMENGSAAIADDLQTDDLDFDLDTPPANPTALGGEADLDDLWGDSDTSSTGLSAEADLSAADDLAALDDTLTPETISSDEWPDLDADLDGDLGNGLEIEELEAETASPGAIAFEEVTFSGFESEDLSLEGSNGEDDLAIDFTPDELVIEEPEAVGGLDLAAGDLTEDWSPDPADLSLGTDADADLGDYGDLNTDDLNTDDLGTPGFGLDEDYSASLDTPLASDEGLGTPGFGVGKDYSASDTPLTGDVDLAAADGPFPDPMGSDPLAAETSTTREAETDAAETFDTEFGADWAEPTAGQDFTNASTPPWEEAAGEFAPELDTSGGFEADPGTEFDPGLAFDPQAEVVDTTPNPFEVGAFEEETSYPEGLDLEAERVNPGAFDLEEAADLPFSTMELDRTVEGNFMPDLAPGDSLSEQDNYDDAFLTEQPEGSFSEADATPIPLGFTDDIDEDLAFESVEFEGNEFGGSGFEAPGSIGEADDEPPVFIDDASFEDERFSDGGFGADDFGNEGFGNEGFDADNVFSDSHDDSNGFVQDRNGAVLLEDEPDATDDFIQEFGSDPSAHVALTPGQFDDSSRDRSGGSGLPLRLILGLGLGALVLALAGLLLNGLLGQLRQPGPGGDPAVTDPAVPAPTTPPDAVPEEDLFRQAVNAAQTAANQAQTASTAAQWQAVADAWSNSIELMKRVPQSDPNYALAQQKVVDYQPNLTYAQQNVQRLK